MRRAVVTGIGLVTPIGIGTSAVWQNILNHRSGIGPITAFDSTPFRSKLAAEVRDFDPLKWLDKVTSRRMDRMAQFALAASEMALEDSGLEIDREADNTRIGTAFGTALGGFSQAEADHAAFLEKGPRAVSRSLAYRVFGATAHTNVALHLGLRGPGTTNSDSCAAGNVALLNACRMIREGLADAVLAGGAEAPLAPLTFAAFDNLNSMSRLETDPSSAAYCSFDVKRDGFVMGEGGAVMVVEEWEAARKRGASIYAEVLGGGVTTEAYHMTSPDPSGKPLMITIQEALTRTGVRPEEVDYICAHASGTPYNDRNEGQAIQKIFGDRQANPRLKVSGIKPYTGHGLGAAGAVEAAICLLAMRHGIAPATLNLKEPDPELNLDLVPESCVEHPIRVVLNHAFGFGGINSALLFRQI